MAFLPERRERRNAKLVFAHLVFPNLSTVHLPRVPFRQISVLGIDPSFEDLCSCWASANGKGLPRARPQGCPAQEFHASLINEPPSKRILRSEPVCVSAYDAMSPKRRKPVRLPEECIHTIAQTVGVTLTPEVAKLLAPDAEYRLRELIRNAKSYMRHSKRTRLTVQDISLAHKLHLGSTLLGHGQEGPSGFAQVTNGVFVEADSIQALHEIFVKPLPRSNPSTSLKASWIRSNHTPGDKSPQSQIQHDESFTKSMRAILLNHDEPLLGATLRALPQLNKSQMNELVSLLTHITNDNATPGGNSSFLYNALRMTCKLFISDPATAEMYNDDLIPIILTCLLGKHLGDGDQLALRQRAAWSLQEWRHMTADKAALARVVKTIVCCLTDREAPIDTVFGAVHGLGAMGREIFQMHFTPHLPALSESLRLRLEENKEGPVGKEVAEQVANLIQAVSDTAAKFDTELVSEMRDIV